MAVLAPSLHRLFGEIDRRWPRRFHGLDGWVCGGYCGAKSEHYPDAKGMVHAIDFSLVGVDWQWFVNNIYKGGGVLWYVITMRQIWSSTHGFQRQIYTGVNPHIDHIHVSIHLTWQAEQFSGGWGIAVPGSNDRIEPAGPNTLSQVSVSGWDWRQATTGVANDLRDTASNTMASAGWINGITDRT